MRGLELGVSNCVTCLIYSLTCKYYPSRVVSCLLITLNSLVWQPPRGWRQPRSWHNVSFSYSKRTHPGAKFALQVYSILEHIQRSALLLFPHHLSHRYSLALFSIVAILPHVLAIKDSIKITARLLEDIERVPKTDICRTDGDKLWGDEKANAEIALRNVTFSYPSRPDHKSLDGVDLIFEGGKVTALVGGKFPVPHVDIIIE